MCWNYRPFEKDLERPVQDSRKLWFSNTFSFFAKSSKIYAEFDRRQWIWWWFRYLITLVWTKTTSHKNLASSTLWPKQPHFFADLTKLCICLSVYKYIYLSFPNLKKSVNKIFTGTEARLVAYCIFQLPFHWIFTPFKFSLL